MSNSIKVVKQEVSVDSTDLAPQLLLTLSLPLRLTAENNTNSKQEQTEMLANEILKAILEASQSATDGIVWQNNPPTGKEQI